MNSSSNLLVLGATGQVGKLVAKNLKRRKANFSVGSRREANLEELADQFGASRFIDLDDPRTFDEALKNVTGIFLITGYTVDMLVQSKSLIDAAKRNGVYHIVHLGAFTTDQDSYATVFAWHQMIEAYLRSSGVAWTNLHPNMFMQNLLTYTSIRGGQYRPYTSKALGFTALEDLAAARKVSKIALGCCIELLPAMAKPCALSCSASIYWFFLLLIGETRAYKLFRPC